MPTTSRPDMGERLFRALLLLYPARFRERFGDEMVAFYRDRRRESRHRGGLRGVARLWGHLFLDIAWSAPREHGRRLRAAARSAPTAGVESLAPPPDVPWSSPQYPEQGGYMDALRQDLRFAFRTLIRRPGFAAVAVLTLALGIGANTAIFSVVNAVLLRPLPWPDPDRLVMVYGRRGAQGQQSVAYQDFLDWRRETSSFAQLGVVRFQSVNLTGGDTPDRLVGTFATANVLSMLGATTAQGRLLSEAETELGTKQPVAVVSDAAWRSRFGARPDLVGSTLVLNGEPFTVIGILRAGLEVPLGAPDVWMPIGYYPNKGDLQERGRGGVMAVGRLKPGVTRDAAQADLAVVTRRLAERYPTTNAEIGADVQPLREEIVGPVRAPLLLMLSAVGIVLLIACANVANLQLARAAARRRELSVRAALGAGRARLMRQLLTESLVISLVGGLAGVLLAFWGVKALAAAAADNLPVYGTVTLERPVLLFALGITAAAGLLFGLIPAWQASRADLQESLTQRGDGASAGGRLAVRNVLVVGQIALCVVLLVSAGLLTRSLAALAAVKPGFDPEHLLTLQFRLPPAKYPTEAQIADMFTRTLAEIRGVPGVRAAALVRATPLNGNGERFPYATDRTDADARQAPMLQLNIVSPGYFETMAIPRIAGRDFAEDDRAGTLRVAIVNDRLAKRAWPNESPIGKRIRIGADSTAWATVVGVVGTVKHFRIAEEPLDQAYVPYRQRPLIFTELVVRADGDPLALANAVRAAVWRVDRDQPVWRVRSMEQVLRESLSTPRLTMGLITGFAVLAMLLATIGVYGVMSFVVARRTQEVGIRMALGARSRQVLGLVIRQGMATVLVALAIGVVAALAATRLLAAQLFGVSATDPLTFLVVPLVLGAVALLACFVPARRASRVDPMIALRTE